METLKQLSKKYTSLSLGTLVALLLMTGVSSCKSCSKGGDETGKLEISTTKPSLQGPDKEGEVDFKLAAGEEGRIAKFEDYKVKIKVTGPGKIKINGTSIEVKDGEEPEYKLYEVLRTKEDGELKGEDKQTMKFTFEPTAGTMTANFQLIDKEGKEVGDAVKVDWTAIATPNVQVEFTEPADDTKIFKGAADCRVELENAEDQVNTDDLVVKLTSSEAGVKFKLGLVEVDQTGKKLTEILGGAAGDLNKADKKAFNLKLENANGKTQSTVTLEIFYKGQKLAERKITWKDKDVKFKFNAPVDNHAFKADEEVDIILENDGAEVHTDEMMVRLESSNNVVFTLAGKDVDAVNGIQLSAIRDGGAKADLKKGEVSQFKIKLKTNADSKAASDVTVKVIYKNMRLLASKNLLWKDKDVKVAFTAPADDKQIFKDIADCKVELENAEDQVNTDDLIVKLTSSEKTVKFKLGAVEVDKTGKKLTEILGGAAADLNKADKKAFNLKLENAAGKTKSTVTLEVSYKGQNLATRKITWKDKDVKVAFTDPADNKQILKATADCRVELENQEDLVNTDDLVIKLKSSAVMVTFKLGTIEVGTKGKTLTEILGVGAGNLNKNDKKAFNLKLEDAKAKAQSTVTLEVFYKGQKLATRKITWEQ